ncbi:hypothetical protein HEAR1480 [Herminiimonas arsenicoxydans]|uniref:Uncharacterized protein n=1 Tax=Herminiimonas arsenicoxydans TaxID=204773 RepID=A4G564_HERAR|nr:hypothetical protein HEAR1480 [Herminiimonas arsenicoxydans]
MVFGEGMGRIGLYIVLKSEKMLGEFLNAEIFGNEATRTRVVTVTDYSRHFGKNMIA